MQAMMGLGFAELLMVMLMGGGGFGVPLSLPPLPPDATIVRAVPDECLFYVSWNGVAVADPKSPNKTERLMAEPEVRHFIARAEAAIRSFLLQSGGGPNGEVFSKEVPNLVKTLITRPAALYVSRVTPGPQKVDVAAGVIVNLGGDAAATRAALERLLKLAGPGAGEGAPAEVTIGGTKFRTVPLPPDAPPVVWTIKGEYLLIAMGKGTAETMLARLDAKTKPAAWLVNLQSEIPVARPAMTSYINVAGIIAVATPQAPPQVAAVLKGLGLSNVKSVASVSGLDGSGMLSRTLLAIDGAPQGIFSLAAGKPLTAADLKQVPASANVAFVARADLAAAYRQLLDTVDQIDPRGLDNMRRDISQFEQFAGFSLGDDLLAGLGDVWSVFHSPDEGGALLTGAALVVSVRDKAKLQTAYEAIVEQAISMQSAGGGEAPMVIKNFTFRDQKVYYLQSTREPIPVAPAWCLTNDSLVVALYPQMIKSYLSRSAASGGSLADVPSVAALLKGSDGPTMVAYQNTPDLARAGYSAIQALATMAASQISKERVPIGLADVPSLSAILPHVEPNVASLRRTKSGLLLDQRGTVPNGAGNVTASAPVLVGLLLPAVQAARQAATRNQATNRLHNVGIAMFNYDAAHKALPPRANVDKAGKPLLSWRVHILPYIEENHLYDQFHLDEPWDSPHNAKLAARMPYTYANASQPQLAAQGKTQFVAVSGKGTMFDGPKGIKLQNVTDGLSNTVMVVEVTPDKAVPWTKPDDLDVDAKDFTAALRGARPNGFLALAGDAAVHFIDNSVDDEALRARFTRAGGEMVEW